MLSSGDRKPLLSTLVILAVVLKGFNIQGLATLYLLNYNWLFTASISASAKESVNSPRL
jgi:hypothetical protein